jgi:hypothetical protein
MGQVISKDTVYSVKDIKMPNSHTKFKSFRLIHFPLRRQITHSKKECGRLEDSDSFSYRKRKQRANASQLSDSHSRIASASYCSRSGPGSIKSMRHSRRHCHNSVQPLIPDDAIYRTRIDYAEQNR